MRIWDFQSSQRPDYLIANSEETQRRIKKFYRRNSIVIYPPVTILSGHSQGVQKQKGHPKGDHYITVSRLARAKHIDVLIKAANKLKFNLKIVGTGRDEKYLKSIAGPTVEFLGNLSDQEFKKKFLNAKGFLFASKDEEFGIAPVEAMGYGLPVIAYNSGGVPEYIKNGVNGYLFNQLNENSLVEKINELTRLGGEKYLEMKKEARKTAERFGEKRFEREIKSFIKKVLPYKV